LVISPAALEMAMLTPSLSTPVTGNKPSTIAGTRPDQFGAITGHMGLVATEFSYKKDEEIYGEDEPAEYVYQVIAGAVRSYKLLSDGRRQIGAFHLPGDVFGLESGAAHRLAAEAIIDTTVRLVKRRSLEQAAGTDVDVARKLWAITAGELRHAEDHMLLLGRKTAMERVATFLMEMDRRLAVAGMMALPMCRRDIGDYLGLTLETISRALSQLHRQGVLGFSGARQIQLRNRNRLRNMESCE
jgi:CRP/FNR family transcriptional regulator, nitrogen fixation regulation protein